MTLCHMTPTARQERPDDSRHEAPDPITVFLALFFSFLVCVCVCGGDYLELAIQHLEKAAEMFASIERGGSRAARLYTTLGDTVKAKDNAKAAEVYGKAAELYASEGDG